MIHVKPFFLLGACWCGLAAAAQNNGGGGTAAHTAVKLYVAGKYAQDQFPFALSVEQKIRPQQSIQLSAIPVWWDNIESRGTGMIWLAAYRFYTQKDKPGISGFYIGPQCGVINGLRRYTKPGGSGKRTESITAFYAGLLFGQQWVSPGGFTFDLNATLGFARQQERSKYADGSVYQETGLVFLPGVSVGLGYAFGSRKKKKAGLTQTAVR